jgi:hypothetical protein
MLRLDYISCFLTIASTVLIGRRKWQGWIVAGVNSLIISVIGVRTAQTGFIPANLFCIAIYGYNILQWRKSSPTTAVSDRLESQASITHVPRRFVRRMGRAFAGDERFSRNSDRIRQRSLPRQR